MSRVDRVVCWWVARRLRATPSAGRLVYVAADGQVYVVGAFDPRDLEGIASAVDIARRSSRLSSERARLSRYSYAAARLAQGARRLPR